MIPQGDPEALRRQITQQLNRVATQVSRSSQRVEPMDLGHNRITSVADPGAPTDAVNLRTLKKHLDDITMQHQQRKAGAVSNLYSAVFSSIGTLVSGQQSAPYIIMPGRAGTPVIVKIAATSTGTADAKFNIAKNGVNIFASDLVLPTGSAGPLSYMNFIANTAFAVNDKLTPVVNTAGGCGFVTIEVEIQVL